MHKREEPAGPELPSRQHKLRNQIKLTELLRDGVEPALKILQLKLSNVLDGSGVPVNPASLTDLDKMACDKTRHIKELQDRLWQDRRSLEGLHQRWGGAQADAHGRICDWTWLYDEDQQSQVKQLQDSIRLQAEQLREYLIAWKNEYVNALVMAMRDDD